MSKRTRGANRAANKKKARARRSWRWLRHWPYVVVVGIAAGLISVLFLAGAGGSSSGSNPSAGYPPGYEPPALGNASARVVLEMWGDFQCPFCERFLSTTFPDLQRRYIDSGELRFVWRNFAWYGPESRDAAVAAYCAGEQGKFWEYHDALYRNQGGINSGAFNRGTLNRIAEELGVDMTAFGACSAGTKYQDLLNAEYDSGRDKDIGGTPTFFINGKEVVGAQPTETFVGLVESALQAAQQ